MTITRDDYIVCNDIFDNILNNPDDYSYDDLLNVAFDYKAIRKKLFDVLLIKCIKNNSLTIFYNTLCKYNLYREYIDEVDKSPNRFMKLYVGLYLENELLPIWFFNDEDMLETVINDKFYNSSDKLRILNQLTNVNIDETVYKDIIKESIKIIKNDEEISKSYTEEEKEELIDHIKIVYNENRKNVLSYINNTKIV